MGILDGDYDPVGHIGNLPGLGGGGGRQRAEYRKPLPPEQFKSVGKQALETGASGLSYFLGALDKPGQAVRGALAGHSTAALKHLVPFSDSAGLTTEKDHVSGRDLTDQYGITNKHDKGWGAWGAGLAADIATDPLTYTTFGAKHALTPIGQAVQKTGALKGWAGRAMIEGFHGTEPALLHAGQTASDVTHAIDQGKRIAQGAAAATGVQANQPLSSLVRIGLPFGGPSVNLGTGLRSQKVAGALDAAGAWAKFGNPVGRAVGSLFDSRLHGATGEMTQKAALNYLDPATQTLKAQARADRGKVIAGLDPLVSASGRPEHEITDAARAAAEGITHNIDPTLAAQVQPVGQTIKDIGKRYYAEERRIGAPIKEQADDYRAGYVHRSALQENPANLQVAAKSGHNYPVRAGSDIAVDPLYRNVPGGTDRINDWFGRFAGIPKNQRRATARAIGHDISHDLFHLGQNPPTQAVARAMDAKALAMAKRLATASPERLATATSRGGLFTPDLVADVTQRGAQHTRKAANPQAIYGMVGDNARPMVAGSDMVPVTKLLNKIGLKTYEGDQALGTPMEGALVQAYRALAKQGAGKVDPFLTGATKDLKREVARFGFTRDQAKEILKAHGKWAAPEEIKSSVGALDSFTNAFKALAYPIWIPAHVRNMGTAGVNNAQRGVGLQDYAKQLRVMTGRGISKADADAIRGAQYSSANIFGGHGMNEEIAGNVQQAIQQGKRFTPHFPGSDRVGPTGNVVGDTANLVLNEGLLGSLGATGRTLRDSVGGLLDPARKWGQSVRENFGIKGVGAAAQDTLPAVKAGRKAGTNIEDFMRGAQWNAEVRHGATPEVAADAVNRLHFDYDALAPFEKNVMRRVMPFYTFARKNLPLQLETAVHTPGVINAQYKPFNQEGPGEKGYVPQYLNSGVAIPLGPEEGGKRQYLSKLGLPAEEAFERLHFRNGLPDIKSTALDYMGGLNPVLKGPLEQLFDTQFHTQRRLSDLQAQGAAKSIGGLFGDDNPQGLAQIMSNSPFTRFFSSADKLTDPRKSLGQKLLNLGTGLRVSDVDTDKQRAIDTRRALESIMVGHPNLSRYSSFYVKPEDVGDLTPEEIELMRAYSGIQDNAKAYAKKQRERIGVR